MTKTWMAKSVTLVHAQLNIYLQSIEDWEQKSPN